MENVFGILITVLIALFFLLCELVGLMIALFLVAAIVIIPIVVVRKTLGKS